MPPPQERGFFRWTSFLQCWRFRRCWADWERCFETEKCRQLRKGRKGRFKCIEKGKFDKAKKLACNNLDWWITKVVVWNMFRICSSAFCDKMSLVATWHDPNLNRKLYGGGWGVGTMDLGLQKVVKRKGSPYFREIWVGEIVWFGQKRCFSYWYSILESVNKINRPIEMCRAKDVRTKKSCCKRELRHLRHIYLKPWETLCESYDGWHILVRQHGILEWLAQK